MLLKTWQPSAMTILGCALSVNNIFLSLCGVLCFNLFVKSLQFATPVKWPMARVFRGFVRLNGQLNAVCTDTYLAVLAVDVSINKDKLSTMHL